MRSDQRQGSGSATWGELLRTGRDFPSLQKRARHPGRRLRDARKNSAHHRRRRPRRQDGGGGAEQLAVVAAREAWRMNYFVSETTLVKCSFNSRSSAYNWSMSLNNSLFL